MKGDLYRKLVEHVGHRLTVAYYADGRNLAVECQQCCAVLVDEDKPDDMDYYCYKCLTYLDLDNYDGLCEDCANKAEEE